MVLSSSPGVAVCPYKFSSNTSFGDSLLAASFRSDWKDSAHLWKVKWIYVQIHCLALWMLHKPKRFPLAWISYKTTCNRTFKAEAGTFIHNSCCQRGRIGGDLILCIWEKLDRFCQSPTTWSHISVTDQYSTALLFNGLHSQMPASKS